MFCCAPAIDDTKDIQIEAPLITDEPTDNLTPPAVDAPVVEETISVANASAVVDTVDEVAPIIEELTSVPIQPAVLVTEEIPAIPSTTELARSLEGKFILNKESSEPMVDILAKMGVGYLKRKIAANAKPTVTQVYDAEKGFLVCTTLFAMGVTKVFNWHLDGKEYPFEDPDAGSWTASIFVEQAEDGVYDLTMTRVSKKLGTLSESKRLVDVAGGKKQLITHLSFWDAGMDVKTTKPTLSARRVNDQI